MRTTLDLPGNILDELMETTMSKSKTKAVTLAITEYLKQKKKDDLKALSGKIDIDRNWHQLRELELNEG